EGSGREPGRARARALLHAAAALQELSRAERLAARQMFVLGESAHASGTFGADDLGGVRRRTATAYSLPRPLRRLPRLAGFGVEDLPRPFRQQQILGERQRG